VFLDLYNEFTLPFHPDPERVVDARQITRRKLGVDDDACYSSYGPNCHQ
jgi:hypothetical protein